LPPPPPPPLPPPLPPPPPPPPPLPPPPPPLLPPPPPVLLPVVEADSDFPGTPKSQSSREVVFILRPIGSYAPSPFGTAGDDSWADYSSRFPAFEFLVVDAILDLRLVEMGR
ncbi:hypothetical protein KM043_000013, partial [Ampulex compressa]